MDCLRAVDIVGVVAGTLATLGVIFGSRVGQRWGRTAEILGGCVLLLLGLRIAVGRCFGERTPLTAAISRDEGQSWGKIKNLEDDPHGWYCYITIGFAGDQVLLAHCSGTTKQVGYLAFTQISASPWTGCINNGGFVRWTFWKPVIAHSFIVVGYPAEQPSPEDRFLPDRVQRNSWRVEKT